jgi:hypothetical protein
MNEAAYEIFDFLPISTSKAESQYVDHLRDAFLALDGADNSGQAFSVMPFHLLFMLTLQFKAVRVAKLFSQATGLFFAGVGGRDRAKLLNPERSVFDFALINERTLPEIFRLIGMPEKEIGWIKRLIDDRNNKFAHAKGGSETDPEGKVEQYLGALRMLQPYFTPYNDQVATGWLDAVNDEENLNDFVLFRLPDSHLCQADFKDGMLFAFSMTEDQTLEQWQVTAERVLQAYPQQGSIWLNHVAENHFDEDVGNLLKEMVEQ